MTSGKSDLYNKKNKCENYTQHHPIELSCVREIMILYQLINAQIPRTPDCMDTDKLITCILMCEVRHHVYQS